MSDTQSEPAKKKPRTEQVQAEVQTDAVVSAMCAQKQPKVQVPSALDNSDGQYQTRSDPACTKEK